MVDRVTLAAYEARHPDVSRVGPGVSEPVEVHRVGLRPPERLSHPDNAWQIVIVAGVITTDGQVSDPAILTCPNPDMDHLVIEAFRKWRYRPARKGGKPVPVQIIVTFTSHPR